VISADSSGSDASGGGGSGGGSRVRYYALFNLVNQGPSETQTLRVNVNETTAAAAGVVAAGGAGAGGDAAVEPAAGVVGVRTPAAVLQVFDVWRQKPAANYTIEANGELLVPVAPNSTVLLRVSVGEGAGR
jgi:hypothetical protein